MLTLCMDTSHRYLTLALIDGDKIIASFQSECFKKQSETIMQELDQLICRAGIDNEAIEAVCITRGPGSYTGVRIAMTVAKVFCARRNLPLYTLSTLRLFSLGCLDCAVILDARGKRVYFALYQDGKLQGKECVLPLDEVKKITGSLKLLGDTALLGQEEETPDYAASFLANRQFWKQEENVHTCVPEYLKDTNDYLVKS